MKHINLGKKASDKITGFKGVIVGFCQYLTGCSQFLVQPLCTSPDNLPEARWFDEGRLEISNEEQIKMEDVAAEDPGCDFAPPKSKH